MAPTVAPRLNIREYDIPQYTARELQDILDKNDIKGMRNYLETGGDPNVLIRPNEETPLAMAQTAEMAELLLEYKADVRAKVYHDRTTALLWQAADSTSEAKIVKVLLEADPSIINEKDWTGETALHHAARHSHKKSLEVVKILLAHRPKIDIDARSKMHSRPYTALDLAVHSTGSYAKDIVELLLEAGADTTIHKNAEMLRNSGFIHRELVKAKRNRTLRGGRRTRRARK